MTQETKDLVKQLIFYYRRHDMVKMIRTERKGFVTDDFQTLLTKLEKELGEEL